MPEMTVLSSQGCGVRVQGSPYSVGLCFSDARRHREPCVWLLGVDGAWICFDLTVEWEIEEPVT